MGGQTPDLGQNFIEGGEFQLGEAQGAVLLGLEKNFASQVLEIFQLLIDILINDRLQAFQNLGFGVAFKL